MNLSTGCIDCRAFEHVPDAKNLEGADRSGVKRSAGPPREKEGGKPDRELLSKSSLRKSDVNYQYDHELKRMIALVKDADTNEVIREIPPRKLLSVASEIESLFHLKYNFLS